MLSYAQFFKKKFERVKAVEGIFILTLMMAAGAAVYIYRIIKNAKRNPVRRSSFSVRALRGLIYIAAALIILTALVIIPWIMNVSTSFDASLSEKIFWLFAGLFSTVSVLYLVLISVAKVKRKLRI